ncbi:SpoVG family protein [bacterium]|nr:SpoVG family protein [bacterium]
MTTCKITNVNIVVRPKSDKRSQNVLGFAEVIIDESLVIRNIKIIQSKGNHKKLLVFPSQMTRESKKWYDICYPINRETREYFEKVIFNAYEKIMEAQPQG